MRLFRSTLNLTHFSEASAAHAERFGSAMGGGRNFLIISCLISLLTLSCTRAEESGERIINAAPEETVFLAHTPVTKAIMQPDHSLLWQETDQIWVETCTGPFNTKDFSGSGTSAIFSGSLAEEHTSYRAVFPYTKTARINSKGTLDCAIPSVQQVSGTRVVTWPLAVAKSDGMTLSFHHLTTAVLFTLGSGMSGVSQIVLRGNEGTEKVAGTYTVSFDDTGAITERTLSSTKPAVALQGSFEPDGTYCFNVSGEATFPSGMTLEVDFEDGQYGILTSSAPVTFSPGAYINLSNSLSVVKHPRPGKISSLADWQQMVSIASAGGDVSRFCTGGEILMDCDLTIAEADRLVELHTPLNGNGHTITLNHTSHALVSTLYADVHDLNLTGTVSYSGSSAAASLATQTKGSVTITNVTSAADIYVKTSEPALSVSIKAGGLVAVLSGDDAVLTLDGCSFSGSIHTLQHIHSLGGLVANGGGGSAPVVTMRNCSFSGSIDYCQSATPGSSSGRIGGLIGDASRVLVVEDCSTSGTITAHMNGFSLVGGGIGGVIGRTTGNSPGYTMSVTFSGNVENGAAIAIYDLPQAQQTLCGQVIGSVIKAPVGSGTENGTLNFYTSSAPAPTSGHFNLLQISGRKMKSANEGCANYMSYLLGTPGGTIIVIDGGWTEDAPTLRSYINALGSHVHAWFITHPHRDHFEALLSILSDPQGITIDAIYYSRSAYAESIANSIHDDPVPENPNRIREFYDALDSFGGQVINLTTPGQRLEIDGVDIKVLAVADDALSHDLNNSCVVLRIWDDSKSVVILGDAGILEGRKLLAQYRADLNCDYLQIAHHGNKGCEQAFYEAVNFSYALVPTGRWIWEADLVYDAETLAAMSNLDGGLTRSWIEAKIGAANCIVSYKNTDWWIERSSNSPGGTLPGFTEQGDPYFD